MKAGLSCWIATLIMAIRLDFRDSICYAELRFCSLFSPYFRVTKSIFNLFLKKLAAWKY